jgi:hypothetical protein
MEARFEIGEVLLTASISKVLGQFLMGIVARQLPFVNEGGKCIPGNGGEIGGFPEGQNALRVEGDGEFRAQSPGEPVKMEIPRRGGFSVIMGAPGWTESLIRVWLPV